MISASGAILATLRLRAISPIRAGQMQRSNVVSTTFGLVGRHSLAANRFSVRSGPSGWGHNDSAHFVSRVDLCDPRLTPRQLSDHCELFQSHFNVGAFAPAAPLATNLVNGFISGNTLTVTSVQGASTSQFTGQLNSQFTAKIDNGSGSAGTILTVTAPITFTASQPPVLAPGVTIKTLAGSPISSGTTIVNQLTTTATGGQYGLAGTYTVNNSQLVTSEIMQGSGPIPLFATQMNFSGVSGATPVGGMIVTDGGANINASSPLQLTNVAGSLANVNPNY